MTVHWIKNTAGKPDSQLTFLAGWHVLAMLVVVAVVVGPLAGRAVEVDMEVWAFLASAIGLKSWSYRGRRKDTLDAEVAMAAKGGQA